MKFIHKDHTSFVICSLQAMLARKATKVNRLNTKKTFPTEGKRFPQQRNCFPQRKRSIRNLSPAPPHRAPVLPCPPSGENQQNSFSRDRGRMFVSVIGLFLIILCRLFGYRLGLFGIYAIGILLWIPRCSSSNSIRME